MNCLQLHVFDFSSSTAIIWNFPPEGLHSLWSIVHTQLKVESWKITTSQFSLSFIDNLNGSFTQFYERRAIAVFVFFPTGVWKIQRNDAQQYSYNENVERNFRLDKKSTSWGHLLG
jgi:hypothetical protein